MGAWGILDKKSEEKPGWVPSCLGARSLAVGKNQRQPGVTWSCEPGWVGIGLSPGSAVSLGRGGMAGYPPRPCPCRLPRARHRWPHAGPLTTFHGAVAATPRILQLNASGGEGTPVFKMPSA